MSEKENIEEQLSGDPQPLTGKEDNVTQPLSINNEPNTNMEVHKHPHHVTHKKKWGRIFA